MLINQSVRISDDVVQEKIGDEAVLLHIGTGGYFGLDPIGSRIWDLLAETGDPQIVLARVLEEYEVTREVVAKDLEKLLANLAEKNLISMRSPLEGEHDG